MMTPLPGGRITATFDEMRPLISGGKIVPPEKRTHPHGGLDLVDDKGRWIIVSPAAGTAQGWAIFRSPGGAWGGPSIAEKSEILEFPWRDYWYDIYGAFVTVIEPSGILHMLCHIWASKILNPQPGPARYPFRFAYYIEEAESTLFPCHIMMTEATQVKAGQPLAPAGNAGFSTSRHVHWEIHHQADRLDDYPLRINPEEYLK